MKFFVKYRLPYVHTVVVGVEAADTEEAKQKAADAFDAGTIWDNTPSMPLLHDAYEEGNFSGGDNPPLEYAAQPLAEGEDFPVPAGPIMIPEYRGEALIDFDGAWE